jgi:hypothetical protein
MGEAILGAVERERIQKVYEDAKKFATDEHVRLSADDIQLLAA